MEQWVKISLWVSLFASFRDFRPVDSFYAAYLTSSAVNFTSEQVSEDIYPINTYATTSLVIIIFLITDFIRYKPIMMLDALSSIIMYLLVMEPATMFKTKLAMVFLGLTSASEVAYMSYAYAQIRDHDLYQKMTGVIRGSNLLGKFVSSTFAQIAVSYLNLDYSQLVYISLAGSTIAFMCAIFLPSVSYSTYFYPESPNLEQKTYKTIEYESVKDPHLFTKKRTPKPVRLVLRQLYLELTDAWTNTYLFKYGIWFTFAIGINIQVLTYIDVLYLKLNKQDPIGYKLYNGGVDALAAIAGALASFAIGFLKVDWNATNKLFLFAGSLMCCILLCVCYITSSLNVVYASYISYCFIFQLMNVVARSETAKHLKHDSFAFIFGVVFFVSHVMSSFITYLFVQGTLIALPVDEQFLLYGLMNGGLALWFLYTTK